MQLRPQVQGGGGAPWRLLGQAPVVFRPTYARGYRPVQLELQVSGRVRGAHHAARRRAKAAGLLPRGQRLVPAHPLSH
eukprot:scaffold20512_cov56-Phaeocystis_antarctica.AAC.6